MNIKIKSGVVSFIVKNNARTIFSNLDVTFSNGVNVIFGRSGSGKSTLLKLLSLELGLSSGSMKIDNEEASYFNQEQRKKYINSIFNDQDLFYDKYTLRDNLKIILNNRGIEFKEDEYKDYFPTNTFDTKYEFLSSGQKNKSTIGLAKIFKAKVVLLDEPTSNLASEDIPSFLSSIEELASNTEMVFIATNDERIMNYSKFKYYHVEHQELQYEKKWKTIFKVSL